MATIFISYRRIDSKAYAGRLFDRLSQHFGAGHVFMDVEGGIGRGEDFAQALQGAVDSVDAMIVLIGRQWLTCTDPDGGRRLDRPDDWVRLETAAALRRNILVLPVLVDGAAMPAESDLPDELRGLARRQAGEISDSRWGYDVSQIIDTLERRLRRPLWRRVPTRVVGGAAGAALVAAAAIGYFALRPAPDAVVVATPAGAASAPAASASAPAVQPVSTTDLSGYWRDDDGVLYQVVAAAGGDYDMARIRPPDDNPVYRKVRLVGRDVEIAIGVLPSGTQQARADLELSVDGRVMTGLLKSTQIEGAPVNWVLRRTDPPRAGAAPRPQVARRDPVQHLTLGVPSGVATQIAPLRMQVRSVAFSPNGRLLAAAGFRTRDADPGQAVLWDTQAWKVVRTLGPHGNDVYAVAFAPDGRTVATATWGAVMLWEVPSGTLQRTLKGHEGQVWALAFSPDGKRLASGGEDKTVRLWDVGTGRPLNTMSGHAESVQSLAFSPDGKLLASGAHYGRVVTRDVVMLWDGSSGAEVRRLTMPGAQNSAYALDFSPDGRWLAAGSFGETKLWRTSDWSLRMLPNGKEKAQVLSVRAVAFSSDSKVLATVEAERQVKFWNPESGEALSVLDGTGSVIGALSYSPDGRWLASAAQLERALKIWR